MKNYHTHTYRCKHAEGDIKDFAKMALIKNVDTLGISDHTPLPDDWRLQERMGKEELPGYMRGIEEARENFPKLRILAALECDYKKDYISYYKEDILGTYQMDYLIGSVHHFPYKGGMASCFDYNLWEPGILPKYADFFIEAMESGLFSFMAHPDLFCLGFKNWNNEMLACSAYLLEAAKALSMPLEINCSGIAKSFERGRNNIAYPKQQFWEIAGRIGGIQAVVNSDAHSPKDLTANMDAGEFILKQYGLERFEL